MNGVRATNYSNRNAAIKNESDGHMLLWKATEGVMIRHLGWLPDGESDFVYVPIEEVDELLRAEDWNPVIRKTSMHHKVKRTAYGIVCFLHLSRFWKDK